MSNKKGSTPPRYDEEFNKGVMALVTEKGMPLKSAAKDLGICSDTLRSWLNASGYKPAEVAKQHRADSRQKELEAENKRLRKQLAEKDEVIEILKNPSAYFHNHRGQVSFCRCSPLQILCG